MLGNIIINMIYGIQISHKNSRWLVYIIQELIQGNLYRCFTFQIINNILILNRNLIIPQCPFIPFNPLTIKFPVFTAAQNRNIFMSRTDQMHSRLISTLFIRSAYPVTRHTRNAVSNDHNRHRN